MTIADEILELDEDWNFLMDTRWLLTEVFRVIFPYVAHAVRNVNETTLKEVGEKVISNFNPRTIWNECVANIKRYGWKIGLFTVIVEAFDHVLLPALFAALGMPLAAGIAAAVPWSEALIYPVILFFLREHHIKESICDELLFEIQELDRDQAYKGYMIRQSPFRDDVWIEKDGQNISAAKDVEDAKKIIDSLVEK